MQGPSHSSGLSRHGHTFTKTSWWVLSLWLLSPPVVWATTSTLSQWPFPGATQNSACIRGPQQCGNQAVPPILFITFALHQPYLTFHFHALEKEMATHSSIHAWRIPGMGEPGGLPSMGLHRVGHDWSDLAAATLSPAHSQAHFNLAAHQGSGKACFLQEGSSGLSRRTCNPDQSLGDKRYSSWWPLL